MNIIETRALGKFYGPTRALQDCTLAIPDGHVVALVGQRWYLLCHPAPAISLIFPTRAQISSIWFAGPWRLVMSHPANCSRLLARAWAARGPATSSSARDCGSLFTAAITSPGRPSFAPTGASIRARPRIAECAVALRSRWYSLPNPGSSLARVSLTNCIADGCGCPMHACLPLLLISRKVKPWRLALLAKSLIRLRL